MVAEVMKMMREEEKHNPRKSKTMQFFKKRWVFPAIYLASAAIILTAVLWFQNSANELTESTDFTQVEVPTASKEKEAVPVLGNVEKFAMPVVDANSIEVHKQFYDDNATAEEQEAALVFYNNRYTANTGIDIVSKNGGTFDVVASLSGTVTRVEKDPILGFVVEVNHGDGITTLYSALENVKVEQGVGVEQGEMLGTAGRSLYNEEAGIHTHFEIRKNNEPLNPLDYFEKSITSLQEENVDSSAKKDADKKDAADDKKSKEEKPGKDEKDSGNDSSETPDASIGQAKT